MKASEFENFFFYLTDKCRALKGKEITPELKSTWELVFAPIALHDAIAAVNYWIGNETFTPTPAELISVIRGEWERRNRIVSRRPSLIPCLLCLEFRCRTKTKSLSENSITCAAGEKRVRSRRHSGSENCSESF